jgi:hypothetical protein
MVRAVAPAADRKHAFTRMRDASPLLDADREVREHKARGLRVSVADGERLKPEDHMRQIMRVPSAAGSSNTQPSRPSAGSRARSASLDPQPRPRASGAQVASVLSGHGDEGARNGEVVQRRIRREPFGPTPGCPQLRVATVWRRADAGRRHDRAC